MFKLVCRAQRALRNSFFRATTSLALLLCFVHTASTHFMRWILLGGPLFALHLHNIDNMGRLRSVRQSYTGLPGGIYKPVVYINY